MNRRRSSRPESDTPIYKAPAVLRHHWGGDGTVGVPDSVRVILRYNEILTPSATLGSLYSYQFRGNSVFDPNYTGAGAQPTYYDNWANMYNSFVVLSSRIKVEFVSLAAGTAPCLAGVYPAYNTSVGTAAIDCASMRYAKALSTASQGSAIRTIIKSNMSTAQMFGIPESAVLADDAYSGSAGNPASAQTWYWTVFLQAESGTSTTTGNVRISLEYDVKFFDPVVANLSVARRRVTETPPAVDAAAAASAPTLTAAQLQAFVDSLGRLL